MLDALPAPRVRPATLGSRQSKTSSRNRKLQGLLGNVAFTLYIFALSGAFHPNSDARPKSSAGESMFWLLAYIVAAVGLYLRRREFGRITADSRLTLVFIGYLVLSAAWSDDVGTSFKRAMELVGTSGTAYFVATRYSYKTFLEKLAMAMTIVALVSAVDVVFFPTIGIMQEEYKGAWRGVFIHKNLLGQAMVVGIASMVIRMAWLKRFSREWFVAAASLVLFFGMLVGSNSATSIGIVATLLMFLYKMRLSFFKNTAWIARAMSVLAALVVISLPFEWQDVFAIFGRDTTLTGRTDIWGPVMHQISLRPWLGFGYDSFWLPDDAGSSHFDVPLNWIPSHAHNGMLELALDGGFAAIGLFFIMYFRNVAKSWSMLQAKKSVAYAFPTMICIYLILANLTEANIAKFGELNWALFLFGALYASKVRRDELAADGTADAPSGRERKVRLRTVADIASLSS